VEAFVMLDVDSIVHRDGYVNARFLTVFTDRDRARRL
jgi:hypothetical protein